MPWLKHLLAWGGIFFDALIVPLLLWRRTRPVAFGFAVFFHLFNSFTFRVGVFPYLGIGLCMFFFPPEQIGRLFLRRRDNAPLSEAKPPPTPYPRSAIWQTVFAVYFTIQLLLPLRHFLYPGNVDWTEDGYRMSWRMMLRAKQGYASFRVEDPETGTVWKIRPASRLTRDQSEKIALRPDMIWQFSHYLADEFADKGFPEARVYARANVRLNGRLPQPFVDPNVDMATAPWPCLKPVPWILPLKD
jgi:hypothetical protein